VAASVPDFIPFEVCGIDALCFVRFLTSLRHRSFVAMLGMKAVIYVAMEVGCAMKPRARANEDAAGKPFRSVVAGRSTVVWRDIVVTIGAIGGDSNLHAHLSGCCGSRGCQADYRKSGQK